MGNDFFESYYVCEMYRLWYPTAKKREFTTNGDPGWEQLPKLRWRSHPSTRRPIKHPTSSSKKKNSFLDTVRQYIHR